MYYCRYVGGILLRVIAEYYSLSNSGVVLPAVDNDINCIGPLFHLINSQIEIKFVYLINALLKPSRQSKSWFD